MNKTLKFFVILVFVIGFVISVWYFFSFKGNVSSSLNNIDNEINRMK